MGADQVNNNAGPTFLENWFVQTGKHEAEFADYNSIITRMGTEKVIGDDKATNFLTERWISTMIAIEATAVVAFMAIQSAFMTAARTIMHVLQLDFSGALATVKEHGMCTLLALKVTISMVPLILLGFLAPSRAYANIVTKLTSNIEDAQVAAQASEIELNEVKAKLHTFAQVSKEAAVKMTATQFQQALEKAQNANQGVIDRLENTVQDLAEKVDLARDAGQGDILARLDALVANEGQLAAGFGAFDQALCNAIGIPEKVLAAEEKTAHLATLKTSHEGIVQAQADLENAKAEIQTLTNKQAPLELELTELRDAKAHTAEKLAQFEEMSVALEQAKTDGATAERTFETVKAELTLALEKSVGELRTANEETEPLKATNATQLANIAKLEGDVVRVTALHQAAMSALEEARKPAEGAEGEAQRILTLQAKLQTAKEDLANQKARLEGAIREVEQEVKTFKAETVKVAQRAEAITRVHEEYKAQVLSELDAAKLISSTLANTNREAMSTKEKARAELAGRVNTLEEVAREAVTVAADLARQTALELRQQTEAKDQALHELELANAELEKLRTENQETVSIFETLKLQLAEATQAGEGTAELRKKLEAAELKLESQSSEFQQARAWVEKLQTELMFGRRMLDTANATIRKQMVEPEYFQASQILPRLDGVIASSHLIHHVGDPLAEAGTSYTWDKVNEEVVAYLEGFAAANRIPEEVDAGNSGQAAFLAARAVFEDESSSLAEKVAAGTIAPYPTGVPIQQTGWALGENTAVSTVILSKDDAGKTIMLVLQTPGGELILPMSSKTEHMNAVQNVAGTNRLLDLEKLSVYPVVMLESVKMDTQLTINTDQSWIGRKGLEITMTLKEKGAFFTEEIMQSYIAQGLTPLWVDKDTEDLRLTGSEGVDKQTAEHAIELLYHVDEPAPLEVLAEADELAILQDAGVPEGFADNDIPVRKNSGE